MAQRPKRTSFANMLVRILLKEHTTKRLFRKPFIMYGRLLGLAAHAFHMSGQLACRFRDHARSFVVVFAASEDGTTTVEVMTTEWVANVLPRIADGSSLFDYVLDSEIDASDFDGDRAAFLAKNIKAMTKYSYEDAYHTLFRFAIDGVALGLTDPRRFRELVEGIHSPLDEESKKRWDRARSWGVDIPETPDRLDYAECEAEAVEMFSDYCREIYPDFAPSLGL